jgi:hypothetical protein
MKKKHENSIILSLLKEAGKPARFLLSLALAVFFCLFPLHGQNPQRPPIDINLIIDSSQAFIDSREEVTSWICNRLDQILTDGDRLTIWNVSSAASVIYSGSINSNTDKENAKKSIRESGAASSGAASSGAANNGNASGTALSNALREAAGRQGSSYSYTLLISTSAEVLSSVLQGPQANLLRISRVEDYSNWRTFIVGLNLDARVRRSAAAFFGS